MVAPRMAEPAESLPLALSHRLIGLDHLPGEGQHQGNPVLGDGLITIVGGVAKGDPLAPGVLHVDLSLGADAEVADHLEVGHNVEHVVGEVDPAPDYGLGALAALDENLGGR